MYNKTTIDHSKRKSLNLDLQNYIVWLTLYQLSRKTGYSYINFNYFCDLIGIDEFNVNTILYYLEKYNYIVIKNREPELEVKVYSYNEREKILNEIYEKNKSLENNGKM